MVRSSKIIALFLVLSLLAVFAFAAGCCGGGNCCMKIKNDKITAANIADGVVITHTGANPDAIKAIQAKLAECAKSKDCCVCCGMKDVTREVKNTDTGATMTVTIKDAAKVKDLQAKIADMVAGKCPMGKDKPKSCGGEKK